MSGKKELSCVLSCAYSPDGRSIVVGSVLVIAGEDAAVRVIDVASGETQRVLKMSKRDRIQQRNGSPSSTHSDR